jgi:diphthamide biosynthesis protein 3
MAENIYDEIEIEDMTYDATLEIYHYPCPCGDRFEIAIADLREKEDIAVCPSCSLMIRVIFEVVSLPLFLVLIDGMIFFDDPPHWEMREKEGDS